MSFGFRWLTVLGVTLVVAGCDENATAPSVREGPMRRPVALYVGMRVIDPLLPTSLADVLSAPSYAFSLDGGGFVQLVTNPQRTEVPWGTHTVELRGGPGYCEIPAPNPVTFSAPASDETSVWFSVNCNGGTIEVTTTTTGLLPIGSDFEVRFLPTDFFGRVVPLGTVTQSGVKRFGNIRPGRRILELKFPRNCAVAESPNTQAAASASIGVGLKVVVPVRWAVECK